MKVKAIVTMAILACVMLTPVVMAAVNIEGTWEFKSQMQARSMQATMTITKADGKLAGTWSTQRGESQLSDITFEGGKVKFVQVMSFGGNEMKTNYEGTVEGKTIKGTAKGQFGESTFEGTLQGEAKSGAEAIVGTWEMTINTPARENIEKLVITKNADGTLAGKWEGRRGESTISNVKLEGNKLTFKRTSNFGGREMIADYEGTVEGDKITGKFITERGEREANATRAGAKAEMPKTEPKPMPKPEPNKPK